MIKITSFMRIARQKKKKKERKKLQCSGS